MALVLCTGIKRADVLDFKVLTRNISAISDFFFLYNDELEASASVPVLEP